MKKILKWIAGLFRCEGGCAPDCRKHGTNSTGPGCPGVDYHMRSEIEDLRRRVRRLEE